jgi:hypothetical protein
MSRLVQLDRRAAASTQNGPSGPVCLVGSPLMVGSLVADAPGGRGRTRLRTDEARPSA